MEIQIKVCKWNLVRIDLIRDADRLQATGENNDDRYFWLSTLIIFVGTLMIILHRGFNDTPGIFYQGKTTLLLTMKPTNNQV